MILLLLKSSACLAAFMVFYKLFLEKESMHTFKRFFLLGALLVSIGIPFITFTQYIEVAPVKDFVPFQPIDFSTTEAFTPVITTTWQEYIPAVLWGIYFIGVFLFSFRFVLNLREILYRIKNNPKHQYHEFTNVLLQDLIPPHTFFNFIFVNKTKYEHNLIPNEVLLHEQTHAKQKHALDILCIEVLQIVFWFNPLLYFIKKDIKLNHEFLADQSVIDKGISALQYKETLLAFSSHAKEPELANAINYSSIKKRFTVMKTQTSKQAFWLRSLLLLPMLAILIYSFSEKEIVKKEVALVEPIAIKQVKSDKGATQAMMKEYNAFIKSTEEPNIIRQGKLQRAIAIYDIMTPSQRASVKMYPKTFFPSSLSKVKPKTPTETEYNSWKNKKEFAVWIDGKVVGNSELNKYTASNFEYFTSSFVYNNARSKKFPQPYQNHLYTKKGFEETYLKSGVKKYNHLKSKYLNSLENKSLNKDELRILKTQVEKAYKVLTKKEIEKYGVEKLASSKVNASDNVSVTRDQVIEYNKLKHLSSEEFHYTNQTYWVKNKKGKKIAKKYYELSEKGKRKWLVFPPPIYYKKQISIEEFEKLFDESKYVVRINGRVVDKKELKEHKNTDFVSFSSSKISELAVLSQKYHYNLFTERGYETNLFTKKHIDKANLKKQKNTSIAVQSENYTLGFYFRKIDDALIVSNPQKQMVEAVKRDKLKSYLQDLIKEIALKPEEIYTSINIEKSTEKSRISFVENTLRTLEILNINKKDYVPSKLNPNIPPPPPPTQALTQSKKVSQELLDAKKEFDLKGNEYGKAVSAYLKEKKGNVSNLKTMYKEVMTLYDAYMELAKKEKIVPPPPPPPPPSIQQEATKEQVVEYNKLSKYYTSEPIEKRIYKQRDIKRLKYLYKLMSTEQKKNADPLPKLVPPPPKMDTISTYNSLVKRTKLIPNNRKNNIQYLKVLFNKMSNSQKEKVKSPNSINKYIAQLDNLSAEQVKKVNEVYNKIKARAESKGRKFYSAAEYKELEELYASMLPSIKEAH